MTAGSPVGCCEYPVRLHRRIVNKRTGEVSTEDFQKRCGSRRESDCPSCSELFRGDAIAVIRSGLYGPDGRQRLATWVTLTAPGADVFGATHSQRRQDGRIRPCRCGVRHSDGDPTIGTPLNPETYRYDLAASFNAHAGRLSMVTFQKLGRLLGRKLQFIRVMEYQSRGLVHVHALVLGVITQRSLRVAVMGGRNIRTGRRIRPATSNGWSWGPECRADAIMPGSGHKLGAYMTKVVRYAVKSAGEVLSADSSHGSLMAKAGEKSATCRHSRPVCRSGDPFIYHRRFVAPASGPATVEMVRTMYQSRPSHRPCRKHRNARRGWGFAGHVFAASRSWGTTFAEVRARRAEFRGAATDWPDHLIVEWTVAGRGYGPDGLRLSDLGTVP